jgi:tetratricopeptide (TPR) repeat protein
MAIQFGPGFAKAYLSRGIVYRKRGFNDHAIADYTQAIALNSHAASGYLLRGHVYVIKGNRDQAIADFRQALRIEPTNQLAKGSLMEIGRTPSPSMWMAHVSRP